MKSSVFLALWTVAVLATGAAFVAVPGPALRDGAARLRARQGEPGKQAAGGAEAHALARGADPARTPARGGHRRAHARHGGARSDAHRCCRWQRERTPCGEGAMSEHAPTGG